MLDHALGQPLIFFAGISLGFILNQNFRFPFRGGPGLQTIPRTGTAATLVADTAIEAHQSTGSERHVKKLALAAPQVAEWRTAEEHARALHEWLLSPGGRTGEVPASDLEAIYAEMCGEFIWHVRPWSPVASELRKILGGEKSYAWRDGKRVRVYRIPSRSTVSNATAVKLRRAA